MAAENPLSSTMNIIEPLVSDIFPGNSLLAVGQAIAAYLLLSETIYAPYEYMLTTMRRFTRPKAAWLSAQSLATGAAITTHW